MFSSDSLKNHLETSSTIKTQSAVIAEWNMNIFDNISKVGNYRYRTQDPATSIYKTIPNTFDASDAGNFYTNATDADIIIDGGYKNDDTLNTFASTNDKMKMLYSLEDCFKKFRPRSGINKAILLPNKKIHHANINMMDRPRYYMGDKNDSFKYWTSYRTENNIERGIANKVINGQFYIDDAAPFVVYKNNVPSNRIVVKMQTNVGSVDLGIFSGPSGSFSDPLYGDINRTVPLKWKIQVLKNNTWVDAKSFNSTEKRADGSNIIKHDGYVELSYGLIIPNKYKNIFIKAEEYLSVNMLPEQSINGYAYLVKASENDIGKYYIWVDDAYEEFVPTYGWDLADESVNRSTQFVTKLSDPDYYNQTSSFEKRYREFEYIRGIRVVVDTMNVQNSTFDLIELSPRLAVDLSDKTMQFSITKQASDLGISGLPVGQLLAGTGRLSLFDYDESFNANNNLSIISSYNTKNIQIKFYEIIVDVDGYDYYVPIKTMYSENFPRININDRRIELDLRDLYFYLESITAPQVLLTNVSFSYAVSMLLDSVGFANYTFKKLSNEKELRIPFFYIPPDTSVARVLQDLAVSSQTAMFFDEFNNFIVMSKGYMMPSETERTTDITLYGNDDFEDQGIINNKTTANKLANIIEVSSQDNIVYNDGSINYRTRYIQKSYSSIKQANLVDQEKTWVYKPALLWEVSPDENVKSINDQSNSQSSYVLSAIPLNSNLTANVPTVVNNQIINNIMDLGEGVYWLSRYNGYFFANGEIIKFDAVEYNISGFGNVWINNVKEYQNYFSKLPFNGKIYPTGLVRIYCEPNYETINGTVRLKNGQVAKHGRGQFGTLPVLHTAGLDPYWSSNTNKRGCTMSSEYLFSLTNGGAEEASALDLVLGAAGKNDTLAQKTYQNGIIRNFLASTNKTETEINQLPSTVTGTIQSSALVINGPSFTTTESPVDFVSYTYKPLDNRFKHFGTRMRIIGKIENNEVRGQTAYGSNAYYYLPTTDPSQNVTIGGGSGGMAVMINPTTNVGYYFEIIALTENNISQYSENAKDLHNIIFYKIYSENGTSKAIPVKLWGGLAKIVVDSGNFTGQYRMVGEDTPTVYDLAVEYEDVGSTRKFYLYVNNKQVATVFDESPLPAYNNMALFVRGSSRCMFENIYALTANYSQNTASILNTPKNSIFADNEIDINESFRKYSMSGIVQSTYLSGISPSQPPQYNIYFEEFGTIMREAAYFNIRYDKAYPALNARISPTFNRIKGYSVSGFRAGAYGAEFLLFNCTDTVLSLDETSGNYLRIQGVTFTQESNNELTVDEYFTKNSNLSDPQLSGSSLIVSPLKVDQEYQDIKVSRLTYGVNDFALDAPYIQSQDEASDMMSWLVSKITKPRKSIGLKIFAMPTIQLGDIVSLSFSKNNIDQISEDNSRFLVYNIEYSKDSDGPSMNLYLSEVK
jgi:hypothetical protein